MIRSSVWHYCQEKLVIIDFQTIIHTLRTKLVVNVIIIWCGCDRSCRWIWCINYLIPNNIRKIITNVSPIVGQRPRMRWLSKVEEAFVFVYDTYARFTGAAHSIGLAGSVFQWEMTATRSCQAIWCNRCRDSGTRGNRFSVVWKSTFLF